MPFLVNYLNHFILVSEYDRNNLSFYVKYVINIILALLNVSDHVEGTT